MFCSCGHSETLSETLYYLSLPCERPIMKAWKSSNRGLPGSKGRSHAAYEHSIYFFLPASSCNLREGGALGTGKGKHANTSSRRNSGNRHREEALPKDSSLW